MEEELKKAQDIAEDAGFDTMDPVDIGDLEDVKEERLLIPAARGVRVRIIRASNMPSRDNNYRQIGMGLQLVNGIAQDDGTTKYKGAIVNGRVCYYANSEVYTKDFFKRKQHLVGLKQLRKATSLDDKTKVDDNFLTALEGNEILVDIIQRRNTRKTAEGEEYEDIQNEVRNYRGIPVEDQV